MHTEENICSHFLSMVDPWAVGQLQMGHIVLHKEGQAAYKLLLTFKGAFWCQQPDEQNQHENTYFLFLYCYAKRFHHVEKT